MSTGVLPFVRTVDFTRNDFKVSEKFTNPTNKKLFNDIFSD